MTDHAHALQLAGANYKRAREEADRLMAVPRENLTRDVRAAFAAGMRKADILRAIDHVWSRQWLDDTVRDLAPTAPKPARKARRAPSIAK